MIVVMIVSSFSAPAARVALLPWPPTPDPPTPDPPATDPGSTGEHGHGTDPGQRRELDSALAVIDNLDRTGHLLRVAAGRAAAPAVTSWPPEPEIVVPDVAGGSGGGGSEPEDLIIVAAPPERITADRADPGRGHVSGRVIDALALVAARSLRVGGIFVVLTGCDWSRGELLDPGGLVVAAGQRADLLYLQHIVALHRRVRAGRFTLDNTPSPAHAQGTGMADSRHGTTPGQDEPGVHRRIHSDVYVFAQPQSGWSSAELRVPQDEPEGPPTRPQPSDGTPQNLESAHA